MLKNRMKDGRWAPHVTSSRVREADERITAGEVTVAQAARQLGISRGALWRHRKALGLLR